MTNIFQRGWNHQPVNCSPIVFRFDSNPILRSTVLQLWTVAMQWVGRCRKCRTINSNCSNSNRTVFEGLTSFSMFSHVLAHFSEENGELQDSYQWRVFQSETFRPADILDKKGCHGMPLVSCKLFRNIQKNIKNICPTWLSCPYVLMFIRVYIIFSYFFCMIHSCL